MKLPFAAALILSCAVCQSASPLEMTATAKDVQTVSQEIRMGAENAALIAAITKVNKDMLAILKCNKKNMFYKPDDSTADADGCVGATVTTTTTDHSVDLANVDFDSYPGYSKSSKGHTGTSTRHISLAGMVGQGAKAISVTATRTGFSGNCQQGGVTMNIADVTKNVATTEFRCHYDSSPNRNTYFRWSYDASTKTLAVQAAMSQVKALMTGAKLVDVRANYQVTKVVLKVGNGV